MGSVPTISAAAIVVAELFGCGIAKHHQHVSHHHVMSKQILDARASRAPQTAVLGSIRYRRGPKLPMWCGAT